MILHWRSRLYVGGSGYFMGGRFRVWIVSAQTVRLLPSGKLPYTISVRG